MNLIHGLFVFFETVFLNIYILQIYRFVQCLRSIIEAQAEIRPNLLRFDYLLRQVYRVTYLVRANRNKHINPKAVTHNIVQSTYNFVLFNQNDQKNVLSANQPFLPLCCSRTRRHCRRVAPPPGLPGTSPGPPPPDPSACRSPGGPQTEAPPLAGTMTPKDREGGGGGGGKENQSWMEVY